MAALPPDAVAELRQAIAGLQRELQASRAERDEAIRSQAASALDIARLQAALDAAQDRQNASADILATIAAGSGDAETSLYRIAETSMRLFGATSATIQIADGEGWSKIIRVGDSSNSVGAGVPVAQLRIGGRNMPGVIVAENRQVHVPDLDNVDPAIADWPGIPFVRAAGTRSMAGSPLRSEGKAIGALIVYRDRLAPFTGAEMALQQSFADQAAIAIENARLFNEVQARTHELAQSLEQQTATSEVLSVISRSAGDLAPVFDTMLEKAMHLCGADFGVLNTFDGQFFSTAATYGLPPAYDAYRRRQPLRYGAATAPARLLQGEKMVELTDLLESDAYRQGDANRRALVDLGGARCLLAVPLLKDERMVGNVMIFRQDKRRFSEKQITLLQHFAAQAVIAIENTRLLRELRQRTDDLTEALTYQTGSADILNVIASSPTDVGPVLRAIVESACALCEAYDAVLVLQDGNDLSLGAHHGPIPLGQKRWTNDRTSVSGRAIADQAPVHLHDVLSDEGAAFPRAQEMSRHDGCRTMLGVPLLREQESIGAIVLRRSEVKPFGAKQVALLQTFADQAVIAIGNVRLFEEVQAKTRELSESLQQQTATAEVLKIISRSAFDLQKVFDTLTESACRLCDAYDTALFLRDAEFLRVGAHHGPIPIDFVKSPIARDWVTGRSVVDRKPVHILDLQAEQAEFPVGCEMARRMGHRTIFAVPLMREQEVIGSLVIRRTEVRRFNEQQIALAETFADQAVIAIENARLFDEVQARTRELSEALTYQTGSAQILKVIASSPTDVEPVLEAIVESACELCEAYDAALLLRDGEHLRFNAHHGSIPIDLEKWPINRRWTAGRAFLDQIPVHIEDLRDESHADFSDGRELSLRMGHRSILSVPLLREQESIGAIVLRRKEVHPFSDKQIALLQTFADQAVIAIDNTRLFEQVQARTRELAASLDELRAAQDRLIQTEKLASLGQLTAGIAHEIKNPLNFVNNFAALSAELTGELNDLLKSAGLAEELRKEVDELTGMLEGNLEKVVQHGKRADSIVKNMLLHSREGSGEHRPADINALVDEGLNLAYHGARAERPDFHITLQRDFDPDAGLIEVFPQEITRVLLNLVSNGFYAATRREHEHGGSAFDPLLRASTRNLGDRVEIRIRDNGTGIPPEVKEKMFNPFFTTKPAGEGTGLGLSMSHDIIVKQHGGTIDVDTAPGQFTEFRIVLPRSSHPNKA